MRLIALAALLALPGVAHAQTPASVEQPLLQSGRVKGGAHITGGGLIENPPRCIADGLQASFDWDAWPVPPVFQWIGEVGGVSDHELRRTFNCGVGFILIVAPENVEAVLEGLLGDGEVAFVCGQLEAA